MEEQLSGLTEELLADEMKARFAEVYPSSEVSVIKLRFAGKDRPVLRVRHDGKVTLEWFLPHAGSCIVVAASSPSEDSARAAIRSVF